MKPYAPIVGVCLAAACAGGGCATLALGDKPEQAAAEDRAPLARGSQAAGPTGGRASAPDNPPSVPRLPAAGTQAGGQPAGGKGPPTAPSGPADMQAMVDILAELQALGAIEPDAQQRLIEELRNSNPAFWPQLVETYRAALEYRRRAAAKPQAATSAYSKADEIERGGLQSGTEERGQSPSEPASEAVTASFAAPPRHAPDTPAGPAVAGPTTMSRPPQAAHRTQVPAIASSAASASDTRPANPPTAALDEIALASSSSPDASPAPADNDPALAIAITALEQQTRDTPRDAAAAARHVYLRLLYLAAGRKQDALKPISGLNPAQQEYWSNQLFALSAYLDHERVTDPGRRAAEAALHLSKAAAALSDLAPLIVRNLAFCQEVTSFGVVKRCETPEFKPGEQVLIYAELENFKSEQSTRGWHTSFEASYQLLDSQGQRVAKEDLPLTDEPDCQNRRRDYFVRYFVTLPKTIHDGRYTLELMVEDALARKIGQSSIDLTVKQKK